MTNLTTMLMNPTWMLSELVFNLQAGLEALEYYHKRGELNYQHLIIIPGAHLIALYTLFYFPKDYKPETILFGLILHWCTGHAVTIGLHRLWSHRSFKAHWTIRAFLAWFATVSAQNTIFEWVRNHRAHHKFCETERDPYNARRGFFYSHVGWLFLKPDQHVQDGWATLDLTDLWEDPFVKYQHLLCHSHIPLLLYACFIWPAQVASLWGESFWNAFLICGALRFCFVLNITWLVNSATHYFGDRPYDTSIFAADNPWINVLVLGEGWHNYHHMYPHDYATSEFGIDAQFNSSKFMIDIWSLMGLVSDRKRATKAWAARRARIDRDTAQGIARPKGPVLPWHVPSKLRTNGWSREQSM